MLAKQPEGILLIGGKKQLFINHKSPFDIFMLQKVEYIQSTLTSSRSDPPVSPLLSGIVSFGWVECLL